MDGRSRPPAGHCAHRSTRRRPWPSRDSRSRPRDNAINCGSIEPTGRSLRKPLDTADKRVSRVLLAEGGAPLRRLTRATASPHQDFGPSDAFVVNCDRRARMVCSVTCRRARACGTRRRPGRGSPSGPSNQAERRQSEKRIGRAEVRAGWGTQREPPTEPGRCVFPACVSGDASVSRGTAEISAVSSGLCSDLPTSADRCRVFAGTRA